MTYGMLSRKLRHPHFLQGQPREYERDKDAKNETGGFATGRRFQQEGVRSLVA
jgi:hypothetical protein